MTQHDALQLTANKQAYCSRAETHLRIGRELRSSVNSQMTFAVHYAAFAVALAILTKTWCEAALTTALDTTLAIEADTSCCTERLAKPTAQLSVSPGTSVSGWLPSVRKNPE
jgi:hypothetical protein